MNQASISHQSWNLDKKGTDHKAWAVIVSDTEKWWPQYLVIAKARFAIQDMWALYFASLGGYKYDEHIRIRQLNIRGNLKNIRKSQLLKTGVFLFACGISCWYGLGRVIKYIKKIK